MNKNGPLDPRIDKLVALLYGELPEAEAREVRAMIDADPALRREWDELQGTREILAQWKVEEESPGFVFVDDAAPRARRRAAGWVERFRSFALVTPWAVATTAVVVAVLAVGGNFRVERSDGSVAFRIGRPPAVATNFASGAQQPIAQPTTGGSPVVQGVALGKTPEQPGPGERTGETSGPTAEAQQGAGIYLTKREFDAYSAGMMQSLVLLLNQYGKEHDREIGAVLQTALTDVANKQIRDYGDLRGRIEALGVGVGNLDYRLQQHSEQVGPMPVEATPATGTKGEEK